MKKRLLFAGAFAAAVLFSCNNQQSTTGAGHTDTTKPTPENTDTGYSESDTLTPPLQSVSVEQANNMIQSYLNSIKSNDTDLHSMIFNADSLRAYLNDTTNGKIAKVKIMFAHTPLYIQKSGKDKDCGYGVGKLTFVIVGFDKKNNYVYDKNGRVMDHGTPCPINCPKTGSASNDLIRGK